LGSKRICNLNISLIQSNFLVVTKAAIRSIAALQIPGPRGIFRRESKPIDAQKDGIDAIYNHNNLVRNAENEEFPYHLSMPLSNISSLSPLAIASALVTLPSCSKMAQHTVTYKFTAIVPVETTLKLR